MTLIDTHTHLFTKHFDNDLDEIMDRAANASVKQMLLPNIDMETTERMKSVESRFPERVKMMMGVHPCSVKENYQEELAHVEEELNSGNYVAVGEIGIDLYWDKDTLGIQQIAFEQQMEWAKEHDLPVAVHCRDAYPEVIESIAKVQDGSLQGVLHCFTGAKEYADQLLDLGFHLGIGGVITFKNSGVAEVAAQLPLNKLVLETDSPYLAPVPNRGKRNESSYVKFVAEKLAEVHGISVKELAEVTTENAVRLFKLERTWE